MNNSICPLCNSNNTKLFSTDKKREYYSCLFCKSIFVPQMFHLSEDDEKKRYELHTNSQNDPYYANFLSRIINPLIKYIKKGDSGLDFGCGPGPVLKEKFSKFKINLLEYDLYFKNDKILLNRTWDFIVTTEVVEHLKAPLETIEMLWKLIPTGGVLGIMTCRYNKNIEFKSWYYKGDPTHIVFFTEESFNFIANKLNAKIEFFDKDITILIKS